jgi:L-threonylcarbamoyladenylate synthase
LDAVAEAVAAVRAGRPVVLPTDTVYGLCASPYSAVPVERALRLKDRPEGQPVALLCSDLEVLFECVPELRGRAGVIARALLPGPYTLVFPNPARRYRWLTGTAPEKIGVRVPQLAGPGAEVMRAVGAVMATSANRHGALDPKTLAEVPEEIRAACGAVVDGGELPGTPSTVLDFTGREPVVIREGAASSAEAVARAASAVGAAA